MIKKLINNIKLWYYQRVLNRLIDQAMAKDDFRRTVGFDNSALGMAFGGDTFEMEDETQRVYFEALHKIKRTINGKVQMSGKDHDAVLKEFEDLAAMANKQPSEMVNILKSMYVRKEQDIIDQTDKAKMIDSRINDYYKLQAYNEEKALIRQIKAAKKAGDITTATQLEQQWRQTYGTNRTRH